MSKRASDLIVTPERTKPEQRTEAPKERIERLVKQYGFQGALRVVVRV